MIAHFALGVVLGRWQGAPMATVLYGRPVGPATALAMTWPSSEAELPAESKS